MEIEIRSNSGLCMTNTKEESRSNDAGRKAGKGIFYN